MAEADVNIRTLFARAKHLRTQLETLQSTTQAYQESLQNAISTLEECRKLAEKVSLFSPNETEEDIPSRDLQYLSIDYFLGDLVTKMTAADRKRLLQNAQEAYERYLGLLDTYHILSKSDKDLYERYLESRNTFTLLASSDMSIRRDTKIVRFKQEKDLKEKLEVHPHAICVQATKLMGVCSTYHETIRLSKMTIRLSARYTMPSSLSTLIELSTPWTS